MSSSDGPGGTRGVRREFGLPIGTRVTGKMAAALRRIGFDRVYDTNYAADLTIMEEGHEFIERVQHQGVLPMITRAVRQAGSDIVNLNIGSAGAFEFLQVAAHDVRRDPEILLRADA